ncbi:hypothetical protein ACFE04_004562 [Oxalis oulophora]
MNEAPVLPQCPKFPCSNAYLFELPERDPQSKEPSKTVSIIPERQDILLKVVENLWQSTPSRLLILSLWCTTNNVECCDEEELTFAIPKDMTPLVINYGSMGLVSSEVIEKQPERVMPKSQGTTVSVITRSGRVYEDVVVNSKGKEKADVEPGNGPGANLQGIKKPIEIVGKQDRYGLDYKPTKKDQEETRENKKRKRMTHLSGISEESYKMISLISVVLSRSQPLLSILSQDRQNWV